MSSHDQSEFIIETNNKFICYINKFISTDINHIFNEASYFSLHSKNPQDSYIQLVRISDAKVFATLVFFIRDDDVYVSPLKGTFGGISAHQKVEFNVLESFIRQSVAYLLLKNPKSLNIKLAPSSHNPSIFSLSCNVLLRLGFSISSKDLNYDLSVDERPYLDRIDYGNVKRIKKCLREGLQAFELEPDRFEEAYKVIALNRARRGYPVSMTYDQIQEMVLAFPGRIVCFGIFSDTDKKNLVASSICILINTRVLYVFYWGDVAEMETLSPIALLASHIYEYMQKNAYEIFDLGTSTIHGEPIYGLINFKRNLGFSESLKLTLEYKG